MNLEKSLKPFEKYITFFYVGLALAVVFDFFAPRHHVFFFWDKIPGFMAVYGFLSCIVIILVAKNLGHLLVLKREDYYD